MLLGPAREGLLIVAGRSRSLVPQTPRAMSVMSVMSALTPSGILLGDVTAAGPRDSRGKQQGVRMQPHRLRILALTACSDVCC